MENIIGSSKFKKIKSFVKKYVSFFYAGLLGIFFAYALLSIISYILYSPGTFNNINDTKKTQGNISVKNLLIPLSDENILGLEKGKEFIDISQPDTTSVASEAFGGELTGVLSAKDLEDSRAILKYNDEVYILNSFSVQDGMRLVEITPDGVLVEFNGLVYKLVMLDNRSKSHSKETTTAAGSVNSENITLSKSQVLNQFSDVSKLLVSAYISPAIIADKFVGWEVLSMEDDSPFRLLGIYTGDIINRVNGEDLGTPDNLFYVLSGVDNLSLVTIDLTRKGIKKTIFVEIK